MKPAFFLPSAQPRVYAEVEWPCDRAEGQAGEIKWGTGTGLLPSPERKATQPVPSLAVSGALEWLHCGPGVGRGLGAGGRGSHSLAFLETGSRPQGLGLGELL